MGPSAFIYPPFTLARASGLWKSHAEITLPTDIRRLLESTHAPDAELSAAMETLKTELERECSRMINVANVRAGNPICTDALIDDEQAGHTRWNSQPTAFLVMLTSPPEVRGSELTLSFLGGQTHRTNPHFFDFPLAKLLHHNSIRIPRYLLGPDPPSDHWLSQYFFGPACIAIPEHGRGGSCDLPDLAPPSSYQLHYNHDRGLSYERIEPSAGIAFEEEDGWW
jgi:hypothetical protein